MDVSSLSFPLLAGIFIIAAVAIWFSGIKISNTTDTLSKYFGLGEALGGLMILAIVTNLPELVIVITAALKNNLGLLSKPLCWLCWMFLDWGKKTR